MGCFPAVQKLGQGDLTFRPLVSWQRIPWPVKQYHRPSRAVLRDRRWPALRLAAKRRDGWRCVACGSRHRLEVDHIKPVRDRPDLAFDLDNLQTLCGSCHSKKTIEEIGLSKKNSDREAWRSAVKELEVKSSPK
ncbi:MAG: HNH endonuclease signature motif containing protein [Pseudomonadota bacterium]